MSEVPQYTIRPKPETLKQARAGAVLFPRAESAESPVDLSDEQSL